FYAYETADAVEEVEFTIRGIPMSDFVYPAWFEGFRKPNSAQFDYGRKVKRPFQILPGGYMSVFKNGRWTQVFGSATKARRFRRGIAMVARRPISAITMSSSMRVNPLRFMPPASPPRVGRRPWSIILPDTLPDCKRRTRMKRRARLRPPLRSGEGTRGELTCPRPRHRRGAETWRRATTSPSPAGTASTPSRCDRSWDRSRR